MPIIRSVFVIQALCLRIFCCGKRFRRRGAGISSLSPASDQAAPVLHFLLHRRLCMGDPHLCRDCSSLQRPRSVLPSSRVQHRCGQRQVSCARSGRWAALRPACPLIQQRYIQAGMRLPCALGGVRQSSSRQHERAFPPGRCRLPRASLLQDLHQDILRSAWCISGAPPPRPAQPCPACSLGTMPLYLIASELRVEKISPC